ncbi:hypothetical protein T08_9823 [Trichinella sp. T8]|nr:hypothetical protein T08_9823 [Trichinella sp. T8]
MGGAIPGCGGNWAADVPCTAPWRKRGTLLVRSYQMKRYHAKDTTEQLDEGDPSVRDGATRTKKHQPPDAASPPSSEVRSGNFVAQTLRDQLLAAQRADPEIQLLLPWVTSGSLPTQCSHEYS